MTNRAPEQITVGPNRRLLILTVAVSLSVFLAIHLFSSPAAPTPAPAKDDGVVPPGVSVFDDRYPAVSKLDPELLAALRRAAEDAAGDGVEFTVNSGWRSAAYQNRLLGEAVADYGSEAEAARWVATETTSAHVAGDAIDLGPMAATDWLAQRGAAYGLCQIYANESWHYELVPEAVRTGCPQMYPDPTHDPRMQS
ncbi:M15 family metallopeptidase [Zhihengliuella halotolerans]|uniref:M15 family metallopeptidase n=1 Tax=Zhihengliuella halotolerans TaxID=370736 RepID=UPI001C6858AD|nr:M15 family metallopeptidase [Zhihengliuella halotolerans]